MKTFVILKYTFREIAKSKVLTNVFLLGVALLFVCWVAAQFTLGVPRRVALDFGLGTLTLSSVGIAIFMGVRLIAEEIESRTVYMVISRPISRFSFIVGKIGGLASILGINVTILTAFTLGMYVFLGGSLSTFIFWTILFIFLEALLVLLLVVFFSLFLNSTLSVLATLALLVVGHAINEDQLNIFVERSKAFVLILDVYKVLLPAFYKLNLKDYVLYKQTLPENYFIGALSYAFLYMSAVLTGIVTIFNKKNLN